MHTCIKKKQTFDISFVSSIKVCDIMSTKFRWFVHKGIVIFVLKEFYPILTFEDLMFIAESIKEEYSTGFMVMTTFRDGEIIFLTNEDEEVIYYIEYKVLSINNHIYG